MTGQLLRSHDRLPAAIVDALEAEQRRLGRTGRTWTSIPASIPEVLLAHGRAFSWRQLPKGFKLRAPKACFINSFRLAVDRRLTYTEGYAVTRSGSLFLHAWCIDAEGLVIDSTLRAQEGLQLVGVPLDLAEVARLFTGPMLGFADSILEFVTNTTDGNELQRLGLQPSPTNVSSRKDRVSPRSKRGVMRVRRS